MYARRAGDERLTFDFAEGLINNNLLLVDRETRSVWSQLEGGAVSGKMEGTPLKVVPSLQTTWAFWRQRHPDTRVMVEEGKGRPYIYRDWVPGRPRPSKRPTEHDTKLLGLGLDVGGEAWFFPFEELAATETPLQLTIGSRQIAVRFSQAGMTAWAEDDAGDLVSGLLAYQPGWMDFYPESKVFKADR